MNHEQWKKKVLDAVDDYTFYLVGSRDGRQAAWNRVKDLLDEHPSQYEFAVGNVTEQIDLIVDGKIVPEALKRLETLRRLKNNDHEADGS